MIPTFTAPCLQFRRVKVQRQLVVKGGVVFGEEVGKHGVLSL